MLKKEIRDLYKRKRDSIKYTDKVKWDDLLLIEFQQIDFPFLNYVFSYYPIESNNEINTFIFTDYLHFKNPNLKICYARTDLVSFTMKAIICSADSIFKTNDYNILEPLDNEVADPHQIDLVIIPLLAFDIKGNRVGYGKGFYDRYLKQCRSNCIKVGLSYFDPVPLIDDANEFDVPLDFCITPQRAYVF